MSSRRQAVGTSPGHVGESEDGSPAGSSQVAQRIPVEARVVAICHAGGAHGVVEPAVTELARMLAERTSRTLLCNLESEPHDLDLHLGVPSRPGMTELLSGGVELVDAAVPSRLHGFIYVPAGASFVPRTTLLRSPRFRVLVREVRARGAQLLIYLPDAAGTVRSLAEEHVDGFAVLEAAPGPPSGRPTVYLDWIPSEPTESRETASKAQVYPLEPKESPAPQIPVIRSRRRRRGLAERRSGGIAVLLILLLTVALTWLGMEVLGDENLIELLVPGATTEATP